MTQEEANQLEVNEEAKGEVNIEEQIAQRLSQVETKVSETQALAKILADPEVRQVLEAKQRGEKVSLVVGDAEPPPKPVVPLDDIEDTTDYDSLSNKDLAAHINKKMIKTIEAVVARSLDPVFNAVKNLGGLVQNNEAREVSQQIDRVKKKYPDFDNFIPDMQQLNKQNPGLSVEELYMISKIRKRPIEDVKPANVATEKPTTTSFRAKDSTKTKPIPPGNVGFSSILSEALNRLEIPEIETS